MFLPFFLLEIPSTYEIIVFAIIGIIAIARIKEGGLQALWSGSSELAKLRTVERDDAISKVKIKEAEIEKLNEEAQTLRREITQRIEISFLDQKEIRDLRGRINEKSFSS